MALLGHRLIGSGKEHVIIMHDWFCDTTSFDSIIPYLNTEEFTYAFMDLRGYGRSRDIEGSYSLEETSSDLIALADHLNWEQFYVIAHSMSAMISQYVAMKAQKRVKAIVAIAPVPACGSPVPKDVLEFLSSASASDDTAARQIIGFMTGAQYTGNFLDFKVKRWRECSLPKAREAYLNMFAGQDFSSQVRGNTTPFLIVVGEYDAEGYNEKMMNKTLLQYFPNAKLQKFASCGHYPMQEMPVALADQIEKYLKEQSLSGR